MFCCVSDSTDDRKGYIPSVGTVTLVLLKVAFAALLASNSAFAFAACARVNSAASASICRLLAICAASFSAFAFAYNKINESVSAGI